jgi:hypothetical protein
MQPTELILAVILSVVVVMDLKMPAPVSQFAGSVPGMVVILGIVFYLFSKSTVLGVLGLLAAYIVVSGKLPVISKQPLPAPVDGLHLSSQFPVTLEETIVQNLPRNVSGATVSFLNSYGNTHNAAEVC